MGGKPSSLGGSVAQRDRQAKNAVDTLQAFIKYFKDIEDQFRDMLDAPPADNGLPGYHEDSNAKTRIMDLHYPDFDRLGYTRILRVLEKVSKDIRYKPPHMSHLALVVREVGVKHESLIENIRKAIMFIRYAVFELSEQLQKLESGSHLFLECLVKDMVQSMRKDTVRKLDQGREAIKDELLHADDLTVALETEFKDNVPGQVEYFENVFKTVKRRLNRVRKRSEKLLNEHKELFSEAVNVVQETKLCHTQSNSNPDMAGLYLKQGAKAAENNLEKDTDGVRHALFTLKRMLYILATNGRDNRIVVHTPCGQHLDSNEMTCRYSARTI